MTAAVIAGQFVRFSSLSDGSLRLVVDVPHEYANDVLTALGFPAGQQVAVALLADDLVRARSSPAGESRPPHSKPESGAATPRTSWSQISRTQRAGIRCGEEKFLEFLLEKHNKSLWDAGSDPAEFVRAHCGVRSRRELSQSPEAAALWDELDQEFRTWAGLSAEKRS